VGEGAARAVLLAVPAGARSGRALTARVSAPASAVGQRAVVRVEQDRDSQRLSSVPSGFGRGSVLRVVSEVASAARGGRRGRAGACGCEVRGISDGGDSRYCKSCVSPLTWSRPVFGTTFSTPAFPAYWCFRREGITGWWGPYSCASEASRSSWYRMVGSVFADRRSSRIRGWWGRYSLMGSLFAALWGRYSWTTRRARRLCGRSYRGSGTLGQSPSARATALHVHV